MAITNLDGYINSKKTKVAYYKTSSVTAVAGAFSSIITAAGYPGAGVLAVGNTTTGIVPTSSTTGYPVLPTITNTGYITKVEYSVSVIGMYYIIDRLFHAGAFAFNASAVTLSGQPSFVSRLPSSSYVGTELWFECVTAFTGIPTVTITYTNQSGVTGRTTGAFSLGIAPIVARMFRIPLATGDTGIQTIESVTCTVATAGTFNVLISRPLLAFPCSLAYGGDLVDLTRTGMPVVYQGSAIQIITQTTATITGTPAISIEVADG